MDNVESRRNKKKKDTGNKKSCAKQLETIMLEMGRYEISTHVAVKTNMKKGRTSKNRNTHQKGYDDVKMWSRRKPSDM